MTQRLAALPFGEFFGWFGSLATLLGETLGFVLRGAISYRHTVHQMAQVGVGSLLVALITVGFSGAVTALYISIQFVKFGTSSFVGGLVGKSLVLEIAPVIAAVVVAARAGSAMAAELGSMVVTEQVDALRSLAVPPVRYLVVPRVVGTVLMMPILTILAAGAGLVGGYVAATTNGVSPATYWNSVRDFVEISDVAKGLFKTLPFALLISLIGCRQGLSTEGGAQGVGRATTSAVVFALIAIFVVDFFLSLLLQDATGLS